MNVFGFRIDSLEGELADAVELAEHCAHSDAGDSPGLCADPAVATTPQQCRLVDTYWVLDYLSWQAREAWPPRTAAAWHAEWLPALDAREFLDCLEGHPAFVCLPGFEPSLNVSWTSAGKATITLVPGLPRHIQLASDLGPYSTFPWRWFSEERRWTSKS
ncbi:MAG: hypothetical protein HY303_12595 [Candidatus Wallbacteria bacterium]|nr:hypothetical protein [Candidatus Wallbacteria bacterium]